MDRYHVRTRDDGERLRLRLPLRAAGARMRTATRHRAPASGDTGTLIVRQ